MAKNLLRLNGLLLLFICGFLFNIGVQAANLVVRDFKMLPTDQTAINRETAKQDQNGKTAALVKIYTNLNSSDLFFDNGVLGVVARENRPGQIWLYLPARSQKIQISSSKFPPTQYFFEEEILPGKTYSMILSVEGKEVTLNASVNRAPIVVDNDTVGRSPVNVYLSYGDHSVVAEQGSMFYEGTISVTKDGPSRFELPMEDENLKYSDVSVKVPGKAEIWFEGKRVGLGEWHARLKEGNYSVELKKQNCEPTVEHFTVVPGKALTINAKEPIPFKGYLSVEVIPTAGTRIFHADTLVATNRLNRHLNIGDYSYTFRRKGYLPTTKSFTVNRNEETIDTVRLERIQYVKSNSIYAGLGFTYGTLPGVSVHVGGTYANIGLELSYTLGITRSDKVYWFATANNLFSGATDYMMDEFAAKVGYQLSFVQRFGVTPQLGYLGQRLRGGAHGNGAMCHNLSVGARCIFNPLSKVGIFITPEYAIPVSINQLYDDIAKPAGITKGGFYVTAGVSFTF